MARTGRMSGKGVAWRAAAEVEYSQRTDGSYVVEIGYTLEQAMRDLDLPLPDEEEASQMREALGLIIGQWQPPTKSIEADNVTWGAVAAKLAAIVADPKKGHAVYAVSSGPGPHDRTDIEAACSLARALACRADVADVGAGHRLLAEHKEYTPNLASAAREALDEVKSIGRKDGRPPCAWYDDFLRFLIAVAKKNRVRPALGWDEGKGRPVGSIARFVCVFERLLPPDMRSTSPVAMKERLNTSKDRIDWHPAR